MARFLLAAWPFPGHLYPQIAIAHELRGMGHECAFYTGKRAARVLTDEGFAHFPFEQVPEERIYNLLLAEGQGRWNFRVLTSLRSTLRQWLLDTVPQQVADLERALAAWHPDVIGTDPTLWSPILILHDKLRLPVAVCSFVPICMLPGRDVPPFGMGLPRPNRWHTRLVSTIAGFAMAAGASSFRRAVSTIRREHGLPPLRVSTTEYAGRMPLYLVPSAPEFDYQRDDLPRSVHYVGPCLWNSPRQDESDDWLHEVPRDRPWVHISEGTAHLDKPFLLKAAAEGLAGLPMEVIMTTGSDRDPAALGLGPLARNIHVVRWVSHTELLPRTAAVVTTGGAGSVLAALSAGVPLLSVPTKWDKPDIAQHVVDCGAGLRLNPSRCTPGRLRNLVERLLREPSFRTRAQYLRGVFSRYGGARRAAELLERLAAQSHTGDAVPVVA